MLKIIKFSFIQRNPVIFSCNLNKIFCKFIFFVFSKRVYFKIKREFKNSFNVKLEILISESYVYKNVTIFADLSYFKNKNAYKNSIGIFFAKIKYSFIFNLDCMINLIK